MGVIVERSEPRAAFLDVLNDDHVSVASEGAEDPAKGWDKVEQSGDFLWDEEESQVLRQARKDAELTISTDSVRAYLTRIGKVALLNAEQEVTLATQIEAGLYAAERVRSAEDSTDTLPRSCAGTCATSCAMVSTPRTICWRPTCGWSCRSPSITPAVACHSWI